ncbi:MAG: hypothetical protein RSD85_01710 [Erysipelotrichaceae bacterium]
MATTVTTNNVKFWRGTTLPSEVDSGTIYFVLPHDSTTGSLYLGNNLIAQASGAELTELTSKVNNIMSKLTGIPDGSTVVSVIDNKIKVVTDSIGNISELTSAGISASTITGAITELKGLITALQTSKLDKTVFDETVGEKTGSYLERVSISDAFNIVQGDTTTLKNGLTTANSRISELSDTKLNKSQYEGEIGTVSSLETSAKTIVPAVNELYHTAVDLRSDLSDLESAVSTINNAFVYKGSFTSSDMATKPTKQGFAYTAAEAMTLAGEKLEVGDLLIITANVSGFISGLTKSDFIVIERNLNGAIVKSDNPATDGMGFAVFDGTNTISASTESVTTLKSYTDSAKLEAMNKIDASIGAIGYPTVKAFGEAMRDAAVATAGTNMSDKIGNIGELTVKKYIEANRYTDTEVGVVMSVLTWQGSI